MIAPVIAAEIASIGGRDVEVLLQQDDRTALVPLAGPGLLVGAPQPVDGSAAGRAFVTGAPVGQAQDDGVRIFLPLFDRTDRVGVLSFTVDVIDGDLRAIRGLAGLLQRGGTADLLAAVPAHSPRQEPPLEQSVDDTDRGWGELPDEADDDQRIAREKPPHY